MKIIASSDARHSSSRRHSAGFALAFGLSCSGRLRNLHSWSLWPTQRDQHKMDMNELRARQAPLKNKGSGFAWTHRWREMDSNLQFRAVKGRFVPSASGSSRLQSRMWGRENRCSQVREGVISFPRHSALLWLRRAMSRWRSGRQGWASTDPNLKSRSRRLPAVSSGYRGHAYTSRCGGRHGSAFLLLRLKPLHRARLGHGLSSGRSSRAWRRASWGSSPAVSIRSLASRSR
jgi:hypothetical protein